MEEALNKAIEGGWKPTGNEFEGEIPVVVTKMWISHFCLFDPFFWQALGRTEKWYQFDWEKRWAEMVVHISNGGTRESFFEELLS